MSSVRKISQFLLRFETLLQELDASEKNMLRLMINAVFHTYYQEDESDAV